MIFNEEILRIMLAFTPGFCGSIMGGIFLAIILGSKPLKFKLFSKTALILLIWLIFLYSLGILATWLMVGGLS